MELTPLEKSVKLIPLTHCWICDGSDLKPFAKNFFDIKRENWPHDPELAVLDGKEFWLKRCRDCDFIQPEGLPPLKNYFDRIYNQAWSDDFYEQEFSQTTRDFIFQDILRGLERRLPMDRRDLLDIGAQCGRFIFKAYERGWRPEGVELHPKMARAAAQKTGLVVHNLNASDLALSGKKYDVVTLNDVLEHIPDPLPIVKVAFELLRDGGILAVKSPCGPNQQLKENIRKFIGSAPHTSIAVNLVHINHFSEKNLALAFKKAGFKKIEFSVGAPEMYCKANGKIDWPKPSNILRALTFAIARTVPGAIHTPLTLNLQAFALKGKGTP